MSDKEATIPEKIREKFPNLRPIKRPPTLFTMNGIGIGMYGKRDVDEETGTYIKTRCLCFVFIPIFALDAFRVADAEARSWYFLGKESISSFARSCNLAAAGLIALLALGLVWNSHTSSPDYLARKDLERAAALQQSSQPLDAAKIYRQQINGPRSVEARAGLKQSLESCLSSTDTRTIVQGFRLLAALPKGFNDPNPFIPDALDRGLAFAEKLRDAKAEEALDILTALTPLAGDNPSVPPLKIGILKQLITANPDRTNRVVELALVYEAAEQMEECWNLLRPYRQRLGATEGARILGRKLLEEGNHEEAYTLLFPYVQTRLDQLRSTESAYTNALAAVSNRAIEDLREGRAPQDFYTAYENAAELQKQEMVDRFIQSRMEQDPRLQRVLEQLKAANQIVHVALELGIVQLNRAQDLRDPVARKTELEAAEKTFLAIRGFAGDTDEYRMFLGQVYYWLGRSVEGRQLFDELLASRNRAFPILMALATTLRSVGEISHGRQLAEEAYKTGSSNEEKFTAASTRALMFTDGDDQIAWLEKGDPASPWTQIQLNSARGRAALEKGNKSDAAEFLRKAITGYQSQPRTSASLNNCALVCFNLHAVTGESADFTRGLAMMEQAIALEPGDSILLQNSATFLLSHAVKTVIGDSIRIDLLGEHAGFRMLSHLYHNDEGRTRVYQQLRQNEAMKKALTYLDKALLLAPKNDDLYSTALAIHTAFRDLAELQKLEQRFRIGNPDFSETRSNTLAEYKGAKDAQYREQALNRARELQELAQSPVVRQHTPTLVEANVSVFQNRYQAWIFGEEVEGKELLQLATECYHQEKSSFTRSVLQTAHLFLASEEIASRNAEYAALVKNTRRAISMEQQFALLLDRGEPLAAMIRTNRNFARALEIEREISESYPDWCSVNQWALFRSLDPEAAARIGNRIRTNDAVRLANQLDYDFNPASASAVLEQYWTLRLFGNDQRAREIYHAALKDGVPLPPL